MDSLLSLWLPHLNAQSTAAIHPPCTAILAALRSSVRSGTSRNTAALEYNILIAAQGDINQRE